MFPYQLFIAVPVLIISAILHEVMHGYVANKLGDPTARLMGRLTLNPIPHIDLFSSILLPTLLVFIGSPIIFGAAKPVPVNPIHFSDPKKDMALTALSGPLTNVAIALVAAFLIKLIPESMVIPHAILFSFVIYNILLAVINLIPIPPLDGSKVVASLLPDELAIPYLSIGQYGIFILFFLLVMPLGPFDLSLLLNKVVEFALTLLGL